MLGGRKPEGRKANCGEGEGMCLGIKLKLGGKGRGTAAEEGGVYECIEDKDFARLALVKGE